MTPGYFLYRNNGIVFSMICLCCFAVLLREMLMFFGIKRALNAIAMFSLCVLTIKHHPTETQNHYMYTLQGLVSMLKMLFPMTAVVLREKQDISELLNSF